jgi:hypothetical protein
MTNRVAGLLRGVRAYLPGFGTAGSLLAGAALMFIVASALVAFRGWPHVGGQPSPGEVVVSPSPTAAAGSPAARRLALFTAGAAAGVTAPPAPAGVRSLRRAGRVAGPGTPQGSLGRPVTVSRPVRATGAGGGTASSCPAAGCGSTGGTAQPGSAASGPTQPVQQAVQPVQQAVQPVEQAIQQTTGALGGVVSGTGDQVGSVAQQTTGAVAGAVQPVSPPAAGAVSSVGAGTAQTVTGVTQTIAGTLSGLQPH